MVSIGNIQLPDFPLLLAPMEDVSDPPFRAVCKDNGADLMYTEFISSEGLIRDAIKSRQKLDIFDYEKPIGIHFVFNPLGKHSNEGDCALGRKSEAKFETTKNSIRCILSTSNKAYIYNMDSLQLATEFEYGGECLMSVTNSQFLFSLNPAGLEVWSVFGSCLRVTSIGGGGGGSVSG